MNRRGPAVARKFENDVPDGWQGVGVVSGGEKNWLTVYPRMICGSGAAAGHSVPGLEDKCLGAQEMCLDDGEEGLIFLMALCAQGETFRKQQGQVVVGLSGFGVDIIVMVSVSGGGDALCNMGGRGVAFYFNHFG